MKNLIVPLRGNLSHFNPVHAEELARLPFQGKILPPAGLKTAHILHGPDGAGQMTVARDLYAALPEHTKRSTIFIGTPDAAWQPYPEDAAYIRSRTLDIALRAGFSVFLDIDAAQSMETIDLMTGQGYPVTVSSCWASLPVCAERIGRHDSANLGHRLAAYETFMPIASRVSVMDIYYATAAGLPPGRVLSVLRTSLRDTPFKTTTNHPNLLARMIRDMPAEGSPAWLTALDGADLVSDAQRNALAKGGAGLSGWLQRLGSRHLLPHAGGRPRVL